VQSIGFEWLARAGFIARGLTYVIIGILAWKLAIGSGGSAATGQGAVKALAHQPFGHALRVLVAIALAGSVWRLFRAALGHGPLRMGSRHLAGRSRWDILRRAWWWLGN
jgi:hypothetical protein